MAARISEIFFIMYPTLTQKKSGGWEGKVRGCG